MTGWAAAVTAVSTAILALAVVIYVVAYIKMLQRLESLSDRTGQLLERLDSDARPALESVRRTADEVSRVAILARSEAEAFAGTSKQIRKRVGRTAKAAEDRFIEFETLLDLLQDEVEDTVLDVAAALRTTRRGAGILRTMKRTLLRRRR